MKSIIRLSALVLCACVFSAGLCRAAWLSPGDVVSYDATNYLTFEPVFDDGKEWIRFHLTRDGAESTWDLSRERGFVALREFQGLMIFDMKYADKGMVWLEHGIGPRSSASVLLDLDARIVIKTFAARGLFLSPDRRQMAWIEATGRQTDRPRTIYVDDVEVFPRVRHHEFQAGFPTQESRASAPILSFVGDLRDWRIDPKEVYWTSDSSIEFLLSDDWDYENKRNRGKYFRYRVSDFLVRDGDGTSRVDAEKVKVERFEIQSQSDGHAVAIFRSLIKDQAR